MEKKTVFVWLALLLAWTLHCSGPAPAEELSPGRGVEIMTLRKWHASSWAGQLQAKKFSLDIVDNKFPRYTVSDPKLRLVWVYYLNLPVDFNRYPVFVLKYRAKNTDNSSNYIIWLDDGTGPNGGGFCPVRSNELVADGEVHTVKKDMRDFKPKGTITGIALGVMCADTPPAVFDLLALNFEAPTDTPLKETPGEDAPFRFIVVDSNDKPVRGVKVVMDAERVNFARSAVTDGKGICEIAPLRNEAGKHMVRVEAEGMTPLECPEAGKPGERPLKIIFSSSETKKSGLPAAIASASLIENTQEWLASETGEIFIKFVAPDMTPLPGNKAAVHSSTGGRWGNIGSITADVNGTGSIVVPLGQIILMQERSAKVSGWYIPDNYYSFQLNWSGEKWQQDSRYPEQPEVLYRFAGGSGTGKDPVVIKVGVSPAIQVNGFVVDAGGEPVKDCPVYSGFDRQGAKTDEKGSFAFPVMPGGRKIELMAVSADRKSAGTAFFEPEGTRPVTITLQPTRDYNGKVVDCDGMPVGKMSLYASLQLDGKEIYPLRQNITADAGSRFVLNNAYPDSTYRFWWSGDNNTNRDFDYGNAEVRLSGVTAEKPLTITAKRYIECMMGKVVDGGGNPVKDARIEIMDWEVMPQNMRLNRQKPVVTNEKGEFTAGRLAKGKTNIRITHPDYKGVFLAGVSTDSIDVTGVLQPKGNTGVTVKVKDSAGRPFAGAALSLFGINAYGYVGIEDGRTPEVIKLEGITDHTGTCAITVPGQKKEERIMWSLLCDAPGYYPFFCGLYEDTDTILEISLKRQEESDPMSGFVTDLNGKPVKNVKVKAGYISASSYSRGVRGGSWYPEEMITAFTGSDGRFVFQKISMEHSATLEASAEGYASRRFFSGSAREPGSGITVQLLPPCEISGKIIYEETRKPAGGLLVSASSMTGGDSAACRTDGEGFYRLKTLPAGTYHLRAGFVPLHSPMPNEEPPEYVLSPAGYSSVTAYEDKPVTGKDFVLKKGILVSGKVIEKSTGKPLADAYLTCYSGEISSGMYSGSARTDSDGRYRMRMLPGKGYIQMYRQGGTSPQTRELTVEEGKIYNNVDIEVE